MPYTKPLTVARTANNPEATERARGAILYYTDQNRHSTKGFKYLKQVKNMITSKLLLTAVGRQPGNLLLVFNCRVIMTPLMYG